MRSYAIVLLMLCANAISGGAQAPGANPKPSTPAAAQLQTPAADAGSHVQRDLDEMESLLNNMATQTSFIRDTNMSILLNTNVRLWSILLRDLRMQLDAQQRSTSERQSVPR